MRGMGKEIEQKFLVTGEGWREAATTRAQLLQYYLLREDGRSVRVRIADGARARLTLKFGGAGRIRDEFEYDLPLVDAEEMRAFALGTPIAKTRHFVPVGDHIWEVDEFAGALAGLVMAEVESAEPVPAGEMPAWVGREVTDDAAFYNLSLALNGLPEGVR